MNINIVLLLVWLHFVSDFLFQTDKMAVNKSTSWKWLSIHILAYSILFLYFGWEFALITAAFHFITDAITSRISSYFWKNKEIHWFFVTVGCDQAIHLTTLILTAKYFL